MKRILKKITIFILIFIWLFSGYTYLIFDITLLPEIDIAYAQVAPLEINDEVVDFTFTDNNFNENLIIKTDKKTYIGLTQGEVYFSITNISKKTEKINLQIYFPHDKGQVKKIEKWTKNVQYQADVQDYQLKNYFCENGWKEEIIVSEENSNLYRCKINKDLTEYCKDLTGEDFDICKMNKDEMKNCDSLSENNQYCIANKVPIGSHKETKYKDNWQNIKLSNNSLIIKKGIFDKLLGHEIKTKTIPKDLKIKKSSSGNGYRIKPEETQYFRMKIEFPLNSSGEFYIEAIGNKNGYGLLDPWWNSNWLYKKQITIDHDMVGITSNLSSTASSGQNQIVVNDGSLFSANDTVVIKDNNNEETGTVSSVSSNTLTMQNNLTNSYTTTSNAFVKNTTDSVNLSNFPVLINLSSDANLASYAQNDSDDIAFITSNETTQLNHEIEYFNGTTGELQAWVKIPTLSASSDTVIYMYYGNSTCSNQENVSNTWDSNHKLVHHLIDLTTSTTEDSTSNNNDATKRTANEPIEASGKISKAQSFDGSNDYVKITNTVISSPSSLTISAWIKKENGGGSYECALHQSSNTTIGNSSYWLGVDSSNRLTATIGARTGVGWSAGQTTTTVTYGQWYYLTASWNGSVVKVYINGEYDKQYNLTSYSNLTTPTRFGASSDGSSYQFKGSVDEIRVSTTSRNGDWIKTSYNNQNFPSSFCSVGSEIILAPPTLHNVPFDNEETPDTTPSFEFTADDPDGTSDLVYQIEWDDNISFSSPTVKTSDTDAGFENTENGSDTSPFTENQKIRFTIQSGDALSNSSANSSYYWRVRAKNNGGTFKSWTPTNSFMINTSLDHSQWTQTIDEQFDKDTLTNTITTGSDTVELADGIEIKSATGTFTTPSSTGNNSVTGVGFQPKAIIFFAVPRTDENAGSHASQFVGFSDGTRSKTSSIKSEDGVNDNGRSQQNYAIHLENVDTTNLVVATINSFDSNGFTLNYTTTNSGYVIHYIAFGGDDLLAYVGEKIVSGNPLTGISFAPDIIFLSTAGTVTTSNDDTNGISSFGVINDSNYWYLANHQGSNNTIKDSRLRNDGCLAQAYNNSTSWEMNNCTLTNDGMSWNGTNTDEFHYLALNIDGLKTSINTFFKETTGTSGATQDLTSWGFTNNAAIVGFASAGKTSETLSDHVRATIGSYDGTNQGMITYNDINGSTSSDSIQNNDYAIGIAENNATILAGGTMSQLDNDGVRITWNPNNTTGYNIGYWAIEEGNGDMPSGSITSTKIDYDWVSGMSSWDDLVWNDTETNGDIKYQIQYWDGDSWELIPDGSLSNNSTGFDTSPVDLSDLNTTTYNEIRIKANFTNSNGTPTLQDWTVSWKAPAVAISLSTNGSISFGTTALDTSKDTTSSGINDVETISIDSGPVDLDIKSTVFTQGSNTWTLSTSNGANQIKWDYSANGSTWNNFTTANTLYSLYTNVPESETRNVYFKITMPTTTNSYNEYSGTVTIVASSP